MNSWDYEVGYEQGAIDASTQAHTTKTAGNLLLLVLFGIVALAKPFRRLLYWIIVCSPALIAAYWLTNIWNSESSDNWLIETGIVVAVGYLLACLLHFAKGILIGLKESSRPAWIVLWTACVLVAVGLPLLFLQPVLFHWIESGKSISLHIQPEWSWAGAVIAGIMVMLCNRFLTDGSIALTRWSYRAGRDIARS